jgi:hypothetical protein
MIWAQLGLGPSWAPIHGGCQEVLHRLHQQGHDKRSRLALKAGAILGYMGWDSKDLKFSGRCLAPAMRLFLFVPVSVKQK